MATAINLGFPRMGANRELKRALEAYWSGKLPAPELLAAARQVRQANWRMQHEAGLAVVPAGDFSLYDSVLDTLFAFDLIPPRFRDLRLAKDLDLYFAMARGHADARHETAALEMTKWFDTNYHYLVPEWSGRETFSLQRHTLEDACREASGLGYQARPVVLGLVSLLYLGKAQDGGTHPLSLLDRGIEGYAELLRGLARAGAESIQIDEPILVLDLDEEWLAAIARCFDRLAQLVPEARILLAAYFGSLREHLDLALHLPVHALHLDLVRGPGQLEAALRNAPPSLRLSLGLVDGRNIWKTDLDAALRVAETAAQAVSPERLLIAPSCSLLHVPVDLEGETSLAPEIKDWLAFARQKLEEVVLLARGVNQGRAAIGAGLEANAASLARRRAARSGANPEVRARLAAVRPADLERHAAYGQRREKQRAALDLPLLPTTTIGSFPQTAELRRERARHRKGEITAAEYDGFLRREIADTVRRQEELGLDVLVHGEAERNDMVEYFGEQLDGFAFTRNGWVQSYGSRCVKPPVIYGDVARRGPMTVAWWRYAQSLSARPVKGMLTGPVTMLEWSFVRDDQPRSETCRQLAWAIREECLDLERAGCRVIQIDEPALREGLPLRRADAAAYLAWAVDGFRLASAGVRDETQIHTHMCYASFDDIVEAIAAMDADVISLESARSGMEAVAAFAGDRYPNEVGPGVYDIHSPRVPEEAEIRTLLEKALRVIPVERLWVNPDCGLKTRRWEEVTPALTHMVAAARALRAGHASAAER